ncbi:MAG: BNR-4 repeat-containing protein [Lentisphaeria bacterium]|nr:BNR-4 repeat-containing protein [Lentisphaeria bacterium]
MTQVLGLAESGALICSDDEFGLAAAGFSGDLSPWDRGQDELTGDAALPIHYLSAFSREREMLGYDPRFLPGMITFSPDNRPVMRIGLADSSYLGENGHTVTTRDYGTVNLIQYLGDDGRWHVTDGHVRAVARALGLAEDADIPVCFGERTPDAVEFDSDGGAYTLVISNATVNGRQVLRRHLVYSADGFQTFTAVNVPYNDARLEPWRPNADPRTPQMLVRDGSSNYYIVPLRTTADGGISLDAAVKVIDSSWKPVVNISTMAGDGSMMITRGNKTFVVFMSQNGIEGDDGSPHYIVEYDHTTGRVSDPVFLCTTGTAVDGHNLPVIDVDSQGYLHIVCGAHWNSFMYLRSNTPLSISDGFTAPEAIGGGQNNNWSRDGLTYPAFSIDANDTLHLVARGRSTDIQAIDSGSPYDTSQQGTYINYALVYYEKDAGSDEWSVRQDVVTPGYNPYSNWYQKTTLDRGGNCYLLYYYYAEYISRYPEVYAEYQARWPEEEATGFAARAHDPVIAVCDESGDWSIATTPWFRQEMLEYIRDGAFIFPVILTIADPDHAYFGATGGWKTPSTATVEWQDLSTLSAGFAILGQGYTTSIEAVADIFVYNAEAGFVGAYITDDTGAVIGFESIYSGGTALRQIGLADFNADGVSDLLLRTAEGFVGYYANGTFAAVQGLGDEWSVAALGDVDGNGCDDIIIAHEAGYVGAYLMGQDGSITWGDLGTLNGTAGIVGSGDFNGDGTDDIAFRIGRDFYGAWLCGAGGVIGFCGLGNFDAEVQDIADCNGDGRDDLLFRTAGGVVGAALITGPDSAAWTEYGTLGAEWSTKGVGIL